MEVLMEKKVMSILIADDEPDILELLEYSFSAEGFKTQVAKDGREALKLAEKSIPDIVILDIMMPEMDGIEVCRHLRSNPRFENSLILILTARGEEYSEIAGFDAGADDYITKPVRIRSLIKRIEALSRRRTSEAGEVLDLNPYVIDRSKYTVSVHGKDIHLPRKEFELLFLLASHVNKVVTREEIFDKVWGHDVIVVDRTIDVHIRRIRRKIGENAIVTVKGVGYKFSI